MSSISPQSKRIRIELENADMDCPRHDCDGWLRFFAYEDDEKKTPIYVSCSNDYTNNDGVKVCSQKVMLSKFTNNCPICRKLIKARAVITCSSAGLWMHMGCFAKNADETGVSPFAMCQRCRTPIREEAEAVSSVCGGVQGHKHIKCPNARKLTDLASSPLQEATDEPPRTPPSSSSSSASNKKSRLSN